VSLIDKTQVNKDSNRIAKVVTKIKYQGLVQVTPRAT